MWMAGMGAFSKAGGYAFRACRGEDDMLEHKGALVD